MKLDHSGKSDHRIGGLAFEELVDVHWDCVYRLVYHLCSNVHDAQDLAQETFVKAIAAKASFKTGTNLKAWLLRIASNSFLDFRRKKKTARIAPMDVEPGVNYPDGVQTTELMQMLTAAIQQLDDTQRVVFLLRTQDDLSFREIAQTLETTEETARWHMLQARRRLMKQLEGKI